MYNYITGLSGAIVLFLAVISIVFGIMQCFIGYKIMRVICAIYGLIIGVAAGVGIDMVLNLPLAGIIIGVLLGIGLAVVLFKFYLVGVSVHAGIFMACMLLMLLHTVAMPAAVKIIIAAVLGLAAGAGATFAVRPAFIVSSSVSGATIIVYATCALMRIPGGPAEHIYTSIILWLCLAVGGAVCQFFTTSKQTINMITALRTGQLRKGGKKLTFSEKKYPGMQRAYRNFCINCGRELGDDGKCLGCGFEINE